MPFTRNIEDTDYNITVRAARLVGRAEWIAEAIIYKKEVRIPGVFRGEGRNGVSAEEDAYLNAKHHVFSMPEEYD